MECRSSWPPAHFAAISSARRHLAPADVTLAGCNGAAAEGPRPGGGAARETRGRRWRSQPEAREAVPAGECSITEASAAAIVAGYNGAAAAWPRARGGPCVRRRRSHPEAQEAVPVGDRSVTEADDYDQQPSRPARTGRKGHGQEAKTCGRRAGRDGGASRRRGRPCRRPWRRRAGNPRG